MSLRKAVDLHCKSCCYDPQDKGTWRQQVEGCAIKSCALWEWRPVTIAHKSSGQDLAKNGKSRTLASILTSTLRPAKVTA